MVVWAVLKLYLKEQMERKMGFEPTTLSLARRCSTTEPLPLNR